MSSASSKETPTNQSTSQFEKYPIQQKNQQMYPPGVVRQFQGTHTASHPFHLDLIQALSCTRGENFYRVQFMFSTLWENISYRGRIHLWSSGRFSLTSCQDRLSAEEQEDVCMTSQLQRNPLSAAKGKASYYLTISSMYLLSILNFLCKSRF